MIRFLRGKFSALGLVDTGMLRYERAVLSYPLGEVLVLARVDDVDPAGHDGDGSASGI